MFSDKAINLGPVSIQYYALCVLGGAVVALLLISREWKYKGYKTSDMYDFFFNVLLIGIIGARIWYVLMMLPNYLQNPIAIFKIWEGGLAIQGGLMAGLIYGFFYFRKREYNFLDVVDTVLPYVLIAQAIGRWGNFFNQEAYGSEVSHGFLKSLFIPDFIVDKMFINGAYHHPTFLYESLYCIIAFLLIRIIIRKVRLRVGQSALLYGIFYSFGRMFIEQLRTDSLMLGNIKVAQLLSVVAIIVCVYLFLRFDKTQEQNILQIKRLENGK